jgi:hypothetical protein
MAKFYDSLNSTLQEFISNQKIFFVSTAAESGRINLSPKGMDSFRIVDENKILWLNLTGSGNETAAHIQQVNRMTIMFCAFDGNPLILRLYGKARAIHSQDKDWDQYYAHFSAIAGARQIFEMQVESVQTSCGFAVPLMDYKEDRDILKNWAEKKGEEAIKDYWEEKNVTSIDGLPTGIFTVK